MSWDYLVFGDVYDHHPVTSDEIKDAILKLKVKKTPGLDCIPNLAFKASFKCYPN